MEVTTSARCNGSQSATTSGALRHDMPLDFQWLAARLLPLRCADGDGVGWMTIARTHVVVVVVIDDEDGDDDIMMMMIMIMMIRGRLS
eukprot:749806-Hanusia_phi.AAC.7